MVSRVKFRPVKLVSKKEYILDFLERFEGEVYLTHSGAKLRVTSEEHWIDVAHCQFSDHEPCWVSKDVIIKLVRSMNEKV